MGDGRYRLDVEDVAARIADRLAEERFGVGTDRGLPGAEVIGIDPGELDAQLAQHVLELVHRAAVQRRRGDHVVAGGEQREERRRLRSETARERYRATTALEARDTLLEHRESG